MAKAARRKPVPRIPRKRFADTIKKEDPSPSIGVGMDGVFTESQFRDHLYLRKECLQLVLANRPGPLTMKEIIEAADSMFQFIVYGILPTTITFSKPTTIMPDYGQFAPGDPVSFRSKANQNAAPIPEMPAPETDEEPFKSSKEFTF